MDLASASIPSRPIHPQTVATLFVARADESPDEQLASGGRPPSLLRLDLAGRLCYYAVA
jgi:hypothetical protein